MEGRLLRWNALIRSMPAAKRIDRKKLNNRVEVSPRAEFVFYRVPKSANSTVIRAILDHDPDHKDSTLKLDADRAKREAYLKPAHLGLRQARQALARYFVFAFVRNPFDRVLSAYLDKVAGQETKKRQVAEGLGKPPEAAVSFGEFVRYLDRGGLYGNIHWAPQSALLPAPEHVDFLGRVETLNEDLEALIRRLFPGTGEVSVVGARRHATHAAGSREDYYDSGLRDAVARLYREDLERLGYGWEDPAESAGAADGSSA